MAAQWLLLYSTLFTSQSPTADERRSLLRLTRTSHMPLCWQWLSALSTPLSPPSPAVLLLQLDVAQRLCDLPLMRRAFDALQSACTGRPMAVEEAVVLFSAAPHLGLWSSMTGLGELLEGLGPERWLEALAASAQHRADVPDYSVLYRMAREELARTEAGKDGVEEEKEAGEGGEEVEGEGEPGVTAAAVLPRLEGAFREWALASCESRYRSVDCSHAELQSHAERIHVAHPPAWTGGEGGVVWQVGEVWGMGSQLGGGMGVWGMVGEDGVMRLEGGMEREEGAAGRVKWSEEWRMRRVGGGEEEGWRWEGERWVVRVRRRYAGWSEDDVQVVVRWHWDVRWHMTGSDKERQ